MATTGTEKVVQYLSEAHATELALVRTLQAHAAMTPRGDYRKLLERHLRETRQHADRVERRLEQLGEGRSIVQASTDVLQSAVGQIAALGKAPMDLVRGESGEEKLVKNAKDECATEALEIATYDALEALAKEVGDTKTAELAASNRADEEQMLKDLRALLPELTAAAARAEVVEPSYDPSTTGAADTARGAQQDAMTAARTALERAEEAVGDARARVRGNARTQLERAEKGLRESRERIEGLISGARSRVTGAARTAESTAETAADEAAGSARQASRSAKGAARGARSGAKSGAKGARSRSTSSGSSSRSSSRSSSSRSSSSSRGSSSRGSSSRSTSSGNGSQPWPGYDGHTAGDIQKRLTNADAATARKVLSYERSHKKRKTIVEAAQGKTS
jgi:ferritin-like metal-binding protein YciE